jgi:hypothetical protein
MYLINKFQNIVIRIKFKKTIKIVIRVKNNNLKI